MNFLAALLTLLIATSLCAQVHPERELIVKWRTLPARLDAELFVPELSALLAKIYAALPDAPHSSGLERISVIEATNETARTQLLSALSTDSRIEYVEPRQIRETQSSPFAQYDPTTDGFPNDSFFSQQWGLEKIEASLAWDITRGSSEVVIAVVDVGVAFGHPELSNRRWVNESEANGVSAVDDDQNGFIDDEYGWDFMDNDGDPTPSPHVTDESHGTHIAGIIAAERNNGRGISGVAPECKIMGVRTGAGDRLPYSYEGVYYACRAGAKIINCSWGGRSDSGYERDVIRYAREQGCIVVAAAGNDLTGRTIPFYPAAIEGVVSVAATDWADRATNFTHYGPWVKISAPGDDILSTVIAGENAYGYNVAQGTSMAAPYVAGVLGLVAAANPDLSPDAVIARVLSTADDIDELNPQEAGGLGLGRLNAFHSLTQSLSGVQLVGWTIRETSGNLDGRILPGEAAEVDLQVRSELDDLAGLRVTAASILDTLLITSPLAFWETIPRGETRTSATPLRLRLPENARRGRVIPLDLEFTKFDESLLGRATIYLVVDSTLVILENSQQQLGFAENGSLGYEKYPDGVYVGPGFKLSRERPQGALRHGSFFLAADGNVSDNFYGDTTLRREDWVADTSAWLERIEPSTVRAYARFSDRGAHENELFARVEARAEMIDLPGLDGVTLLYRIENRSINTWHECYAGLFLDWDFGAATRNLSNFDSRFQVAGVSTDVPGYPELEIFSLLSPLSVYSVIDNRGQIDPPARWSDSTKWQLLRSGIGSSPTAPMDLSQLVAVGPFSLAAGETTWVQFIVDINHLQTADPPVTAEQIAAQAKQRVGAVVMPVVVAPNPLAGTLSLTIRTAAAERIDFTLFNILGQTVFLRRQIPVIGGAAQLDLPPTGIGNGIFFYNIQYGGREDIGKLLIVR